MSIYKKPENSFSCVKAVVLPGGKQANTIYKKFSATLLVAEKHATSYALIVPDNTLFLQSKSEKRIPVSRLIESASKKCPNDSAIILRDENSDVRFVAVPLNTLKSFLEELSKPNANLQYFPTLVKHEDGEYVQIGQSSESTIDEELKTKALEELQTILRIRTQFRATQLSGDPKNAQTHHRW